MLRFGERSGSGDGEREAPMTRQMPYEPLPASVLFGQLLVTRAHERLLSRRERTPHQQIHASATVRISAQTATMVKLVLEL